MKKEQNQVTIYLSIARDLNPSLLINRLIVKGLNVLKIDFYSIRQLIYSFGKILTLSLLLVLSQITHAQIDSMKFVPSKDNSIYSEDTLASNGKGFYIFAGKTLNGTSRRALMKFDFSIFPANVQVQSVKLELAVTGGSANSTSTYNFSLHKLSKDWGEGNSSGSGLGAPAMTNDATWKYTFYPSNNWTNRGGDFVPSPSITSSITFTPFPLNYGVLSNVGMKADVINWLSNPSNNFGWIMIGDESTPGSAMKFASKDGNFYPKPTLTIFYTLPTTDKVLINEVNPQKKWIELYNPSKPVVNLNNYYLANGSSTQNLSNMMVLNGSLTLDSAKYVVINWSGMGQTDGELALFNGNPATAEMKDYVQYGSSNHARAYAAVTAQVWDNANNFLLTITADTLTNSLNGNNVYTSGKTTNSTSFVIQRQTPTYRNLLCPSTISLTGNVLDARYNSSGLLEMMGNISSTSTVKSSSQSYIQLNVNTLINAGAKFQAQILGCPSN